MDKQATDRTVGGLMPRPKTDADGRRRKRLEDLQRERDLEMADSRDQFEEEFAKDSEAPLTDAVRAARVTAAKPSMDEGVEYSDAYDGYVAEAA
jgi:hypothetical protein